MLSLMKYTVLCHQLFLGGRASDTLNVITMDEAREFRHRVSEEGLSFSYLMNSPNPDNIILGEETSILRQLDQIFELLQPDSLVIASLDMMKLVRNRYKDIPIYVSTTARVSGSLDVDKYLNINPKKIIVQHDVNRNFDSLKSIIEKCTSKDIDVVLMLTESCLRECPYMIDHYITVGQGKNDESDRKSTRLNSSHLRL
jgi:collagenase-like PrtC family protease